MYGPGEVLGANRDTIVEDGRVVRWLRASDVEVRPTNWLWQQRIPMSNVSLLVGEPGLGKSTLALELAARVTRGELAGDLLHTPSRVILASAEDAFTTTINPRLMAAGADLSRIEFAEIQRDGHEQMLSLPDDIAVLNDRALQVNAKLVIVDPLVAFLDGKIDSHRDASVRQILAPLAQMAELRQLAVLAIVHLNKASNNDVLHRVQGSVGFVGAARSVLAFARDPESDDDRARVLVAAKNNLAALAGSTAYKVEGREIVTDQQVTVQTSAAVPVGPSTVTRDTLIASAEERTAIVEAIEWLDAELPPGGQRPQAELKKAAEDAGIAYTTLKRAKLKLDVSSEQVRTEKKIAAWHWTRGPASEDTAPLGPLGPVGPLDLEDQGDQGDQEVLSPKGVVLLTHDELCDRLIAEFDAREVA